MATLPDWDFFNNHVQSGLTDGQFVSSQTVLVCAGPPSLTLGNTGAARLEGERVWPIGLLAQWSVNQTMAVVPIPEAGSYLRYVATGPVDCSLSLGRTLYHGPSLLRGLHAVTSANDPRGAVINPLIKASAAQFPRYPMNRVSRTPGYENFFIDLSSEVFTQPVGLLFFFADSGREGYGAFYAESVYIPNHSLSTGPGQLVLSESTNLMAARIRPVELAPSTLVPLMSRWNDRGKITTAGTMNGVRGAVDAPMTNNL